MRLYLKNIGKVAEACVEINGITVIAGENDTGKSTVGRALFSMFNSFYEVENQIRQERLFSIVNVLTIVYYSGAMQENQLNEYAEDILQNAKEYKNAPEHLRKYLCSVLGLQSEQSKTYAGRIDLDNIAKRICGILCVSDYDIFQSVLNQKTDSEFNGQLLNFYSEECGSISLNIKGEELSVKVSAESVSVNEINHCLHTEAIYIDNPFILDNLDLTIIRHRRGYFDHQEQLENKLAFKRKNSSVVEEIVVEKRLEKIYDMISSVCGGRLVRQKNSRLGYQLKNSDKTLSVKNLSAGLKTFAILKTLLTNGALTDNGVIILDEPEIHLHPEWQLLFAELIVLLYKEFHMHILLNTHSPYFLRAIEVYAAKYNISDMCKYYLSEGNEEGAAYIKDVTDNIDKIYQKLSRPLQQLEDERTAFKCI